MLPFNQSFIYITQNFEDSKEKIKQELSLDYVIEVLEDKFLLEHSKEVTRVAYIKENRTKYIIFGGLEFGAEAQNSMLKLLEEPPKNIYFIIFSPTKSQLLPTIRSRLAVFKEETKKEDIQIDTDFKKLTLQNVFEILKYVKTLSRVEAKQYLQAIQKKIIQDGVILNTKQLESFEKGFMALELNSRVQNVFSYILMSLVVK